MIVAIKDELSSLLNTSALSTDSIEGWLVIFLIAFLIYNLSKKAIRFVGWSITCIFFIQICHWLSLTGFNDVIPLSTIFKYDILTSIAQCFVGSRLCDILLYLNAFIRMVCFELWSVISGFYNEYIAGNFDGLFDNIMTGNDVT